MQPFAPRLIPGIVLILLGFGFLLDSFGVINFGHFASQWWPLIVVAVGLRGMQNEQGNRGGGTVTVLVGLVLLLWTLDMFTFNIWSLFWPVMLILIGFSMIGGKVGLNRNMSSDDRVDLFAAFGGTERRVGSKSFKGGTITALFGGVALDLREAAFEDGAEIQVTAAFGGAEIIVPKNVNVIVNVLPLFGGSEDATEHKNTTQTLRVSGVVSFGGVSIKNKE